MSVSVRYNQSVKRASSLAIMSFLIPTMVAGQLLLPAYAAEEPLFKVEIEKDVSKSDTTVGGSSSGSSDLDNKDLTIEDVTVEGNRLVATDSILEVVKTRRGDKFDRDQVVRDLKAVNNMGYFDDRSLQVVPEVSGSGGVLLKIRVTENAPVTEFSFQGNSVVSNEELSKMFGDQLGKPQNLTQLSSAIDKVEQSYHEKGYTLARVTDVKDDPDGSVHLSIDEGVINSIQIAGNKKTKDFIIKNNIKLKPGTVYNEKQLTADLRKLFANGYFQDIRRSLSPSTSDPDKYDLKVEVDEKRTGSVGLGGGVDTIAGPFGSFSFSDSNFRGRGQAISFNSNMGSGMFGSFTNAINNGGNNFIPTKKTFQVEASFIEPSLRGGKTGMAVTGFGRDLASMSIDDALQRSVGLNVNFSRQIKEHLTANLGILGENTFLRGMTNLNMDSAIVQNAMKFGYANSGNALSYAEGIRKQQMKGGTYFGVNPSLTYDTRDAMFDTHKGTMAKLTAGPNIGLNGASFFKAGASVSKYVPVGKDNTLAFNVQGGSGIGGMPQFAAYRLGGWNGIRGYRMFSDLGTGTGMLMASAELRLKIPMPKGSPSTKTGAIVNAIQKNSKFVLFADAGGTSGGGLFNSLYARSAMGAAVGVGLRMNLPYVGPIRIDYGLPLIAPIGGKLVPRMTFGFGDKF